MSTFAESVGRKSAQRQTRRSGGTAAAAQLSTRLDRFGDGCLLVAMFVVPMTSACLQEFGIAVFVACSLLMSLTWAIRQILVPSSGSGATGAEVIALAAVALVCLQLVPLPPAALDLLVPFSGAYLPLWGDPAGQVLGGSSWQTVSLTPALTRSGLVLLIAYSLFFLTLLQRLQTKDHVDRVMKAVALTASLMAVLGIGQLFFGNGQFLWMFDHPFRTAAWPAKGAFSNQNHFAHFLALGAGPLIWWWHQSTQQKSGVVQGSVRTNGFGVRRSTESHKRVLSTAVAVVLLAGALSFSRAGTVAIVLATLLSLRVMRGQWGYLMRFGLPAIGFIAVCLWLFGTEYIASRWGHVRESDSLQELLGGRFTLWSALLESLPTFRMAGSGLGSHAEVYPTWLVQDFGVRFSHAESGYLQILVEMGVPGLLLLCAGLILIARWSWTLRQSADPLMKSRGIPLTAAFVVSVLHSLVDFVWYIPGCMIITLTLAACLCRCAQLSRAPVTEPRGVVESRWPPILAWLVVLLIVPAGKLSADIAVRDAQSEHDWNEYRRHAISAGDSSTYESLDPLDNRLDIIILHLENCVRIDPSDYRAASDLSAMYLRRFERHQEGAENRMAVREIRDTVRTAEFESPQEIAEWLKRAFGPQASDLYRALAMARRAVQGQPTRGETYLVLAQTGFVAGMTEAEEDALIEQAIRLRPHKAAVLFVAGLSLAEDGRLEDATDFWQKAFHLDPAIRPMIVKGLVPLMPAQELIDRLAPDPDGLWLLFKEYGRTEQISEQNEVAEWYAQNFARFSSDSQHSSGRFFWRRSHDLLLHGGHRKAALQCLIRAVAQVPQDFSLRKQLGLEFMANSSKEEALRELEWCEVRMPDDTEIAEALARLRDPDAREVPL